MHLTNPNYYYFPRYLQQLVKAQGARNRELEQELRAYRDNHQHPQHHQYHQQEDMVVDMGMNMEMIGGMNTMNGGTLHFNGVDNNNASPEDLRGRPRAVRHPDSDSDNTAGAVEALKEEEDDDGVVDGFGVGNGRTNHGM